MKLTIHLLTRALILCLLLPACKSINKTQAGSAIGTAGGGAIGAVVGKASGNSALGAIIGASVGGVTGAVIGQKMDTQAGNLKRDVRGAKVERIAEGIVVEFNCQILFASGSTTLSTSSEKNLDQLGKVLTKYPDTNIEIQGHTDNNGKDSLNQALSESRANSVAAYLSKKHIPSDRITTKGFGDSAPKYSNTTEKGRSENRRVEFLITANERMKDQARIESEKK